MVNSVFQQILLETHVRIKTDVVQSLMILLLSGNAMKAAGV